MTFKGDVQKRHPKAAFKLLSKNGIVTYAKSQNVGVSACVAPETLPLSMFKNASNGFEISVKIL